MLLQSSRDSKSTKRESEKGDQRWPLSQDESHLCVSPFVKGVEGFLPSLLVVCNFSNVASRTFCLICRFHGIITHRLLTFRFVLEPEVSDLEKRKD